jgi:outer membrane protein OmpA-like peptidoglycan-associated protein
MKHLAIVSLMVVFFMSCSKTENKDTTADGKETMVLKKDENVSDNTKRKTNWNEVDLTSPVVKYDEVKSTDIEVRGNNEYSIYSVDEKILFDTDKAAIGKKGKEKLKEVAQSVKKRHPKGEIAVYGYTDATGSAEYNKDLSKERAEAVADYLKQNSEIESDNINVIAKGEQNATASNETAEGRQKNRRVEIVVRN